MKYLTLFYLLTFSSLLLADDKPIQYEDGQLLYLEGGTRKNGNKNEFRKVNEFLFGGKPMPGHVPVFKTWSITKTKNPNNDREALLEGILINEKTGKPEQGVFVYCQYDNRQLRLFAISDVDGRIKMNIQILWDTHGGNSMKLTHLYIGKATSAGLTSRVYNAKLKNNKAANKAQ